MIDISKIKENIISFIKEKGPSLPVHISRAIGMSHVITSAIISELLNEQRVKMSFLRVGGSSLYFINGQEKQLERFIDNLNSFEKQAFNRLKTNKILTDDEQEPAIRVALKSIKDFAISFEFENKIFWKYFSIKNEEAKQLLIQQNEVVKKQEPIVHKEKFEEIKKPFIEEQKIQKEKQLLELKTKKQLKISPNKFLEEVKKFLIKKDIEIIEELKSDRKEITAIARINSDLGKIKFFMIAKDKKRFIEADLLIAYKQAIDQKMPCLFICRGGPSKTTQKMIEEYENLIKIEKIHV